MLEGVAFALIDGFAAFVGDGLSEAEVSTCNPERLGSLSRIIRCDSPAWAVVFPTNEVDMKCTILRVVCLGLGASLKRFGNVVIT